MKKYHILLLSLVLAFAMSTSNAAEDGDNIFEREWSSQNTTVPYGIPYTLWDCVTLPDFNDNGRDELFIAADDPVRGAWYFVVEAVGNDDYEIIWYYFIEACEFSNVANFTCPDSDIDGDGLPELLAGVAQVPGSGLPGLWIWEKDTTITETFGSASALFPFSMDEPTATIQLSPEGGGVTCVFATQLDTDPNSEIVICGNDGRILSVLEDNRQDLAYPLFQTEYADTLNYSAWGYYQGDLDNDGRMDFGVGTSDFNSIRIYENTGLNDDYFAYDEIKLDDDVDGYCLRGMGTADINGDGLGEIIYVRYDSPGKVFIVTNEGEIADIDETSVHEIYQNPDGEELSGFAFGDMDHGFGSDGPDLYFVESFQRIVDLEYAGVHGDSSIASAPGMAENWEKYVLYGNDSQRMQKVAVSDYDRDGEGEIAAIYSGNSDDHYLEFIEHEQLPDAQFYTMWHDDPDSAMSNDPVDSNPRGIYAGSDVDQDGRPEVICTEYDGKFHVYEVVANNVVEWVFSYDHPPAPATGSQPREILVADMDGNGLKEIICHMGGSDVQSNPDSLGFYFFEWDGSSDNGFGYGGRPTYILPALTIDPRLTATDRTESFAVEDVDSDGVPEMIWACDSGDPNGDGFYIVSCTDGSLTGDPVWNVELSVYRGAGEIDASPKCVAAADCDGDGAMEAIFTAWQNGQISFYESIGPDSYEETTIYSDMQLRNDYIHKSLAGYDVDRDGDDELLFMLYDASSIIALDSPGDIRNIDVNNPAHLSVLRENAGGSGLTGAVGDQDGDGLPEYYYPLYDRGAVQMLEYAGGASNIMDPGSYMLYDVYHDRDFRYGKYYTDGVFSNVHGSFSICIPEVDMDGDGRGEIVVSMIESPYSDTWLYIFEHVGPTGIAGEQWSVITPDDYVLHQNYPNPFNSGTTIKYNIALNKNVSIHIYNMLGQAVKVLVDARMHEPGDYSVVWDGRDSRGSEVASGVYFCRLQAGSVVKTQRMLLLR